MMLKLVNETPTHYGIEEHSSEDINDDVIKYHLIAKEDLKALFQVVNRPLNQEEMKHGMWVYDSKEQEYIKLDFMFDGKLLTCWRLNFPYRQDFIYEYGRYYRYQPLDDEV